MNRKAVFLLGCLFPLLNVNSKDCEGKGESTSKSSLVLEYVNAFSFLLFQLALFFDEFALMSKS